MLMINAKGEALPNKDQKTIISKHTFKYNTSKLICEEVLYVSDQKHESHYRKSHANNKGMNL